MLTPGRPGVADRVGLNRAQDVRRDAGDAPACELELGLGRRYVPGAPPVRRHRRIPQRNHQLPCVHPRDPRIGTGSVCHPHRSGAGRVRTGRLRQVGVGPRPAGTSSASAEGPMPPIITAHPRANELARKARNRLIKSGLKPRSPGSWRTRRWPLLPSFPRRWIAT